MAEPGDENPPKSQWVLELARTAWHELTALEKRVFFRWLMEQAGQDSGALNLYLLIREALKKPRIRSSSVTEMEAVRPKTKIPPPLPQRPLGDDTDD